MKPILIPSFLSLLIVFSCSSVKDKSENQTVARDLSGTISISGAYAMSPLIRVWADEFMKLNPELKITVRENGTGAGIADLIAGKSNIAMVSQDLSPGQEDLGLWKITVTREGVIPVINSMNPVAEKLLQTGMSRKELARAFSGKEKQHWGHHTEKGKQLPIHVYIRADESGAAFTWAKYLEINMKELNSTPLVGDSGILSAIQKDPLGLSFCNSHYAYDPKTNSQVEGIKVLPIDFNGNGKLDKKEDIFYSIERIRRSVYLGLYPSYLCRDLFLVFKEKPTDPNLVEFVRWVMNEGQEYAEKAGYCEMRHCDREDALRRLNDTITE